jgi:hypothetical protein
VARQKPSLKPRALFKHAILALRQRDELLLLVVVEHRVEGLARHRREFPTKPLTL